jgi:hypothetical protein
MLITAPPIFNDTDIYPDICKIGELCCCHFFCVVHPDDEERKKWNAKTKIEKTEQVSILQITHPVCEFQAVLLN